MPEPTTAAGAIRDFLSAHAGEAFTLRDIVSACCRRDADGVPRAIGVSGRPGYSRRAQYVYQMAIAKLVKAGAVLRRRRGRGESVNRYTWTGGHDDA